MSDAQPINSSARELEKSATQVGVLRENVRSGQLQLDPSAGAKIQSMLLEQQDRVENWLNRAQALARAPLGSNPVGDAMAGKFAKRVSGADDSLVVVLGRYRHVLEQAHDAVSEAMRQYRDLEENAADSLQNLDR